MMDSEELLIRSVVRQVTATIMVVAGYVTIYQLALLYYPLVEKCLVK